MTLDDLKAADEVIRTNSLIGVVPLLSIDERGFESRVQIALSAAVKIERRGRP